MNPEIHQLNTMREEAQQLMAVAQASGSDFWAMLLGEHIALISAQIRYHMKIQQA